MVKTHEKRFAGHIRRYVRQNSVMPVFAINAASPDGWSANRFNVSPTARGPKSPDRERCAGKFSTWFPPLGSAAMDAMVTGPRHLALGIVDGPTRAEDLVERI